MPEAVEDNIDGCIWRLQLSERLWRVKYAQPMPEELIEKLQDKEYYSTRIFDRSQARQEVVSNIRRMHAKLVERDE
jgi:hypothetical protein